MLLLPFSCPLLPPFSTPTPIPYDYLHFMLSGKIIFSFYSSRIFGGSHTQINMRQVNRRKKIIMYMQEPLRNLRPKDKRGS